MSVETRVAVRAALQPHAARMAPMAFEDACNLWGDDFTGLNEGQVKELVEARLANPRYAHFLQKPGKPGQQPATPQTPAAPDQSSQPLSDRQARQLENQERLTESLKRTIAAHQALAPGLAYTGPMRDWAGRPVGGDQS